ncbi:MAG: tetratricopeptide repeat protein [Gemmataceae bacterium]|nr:tetratricopeptide repeat protein [Gemmataceae bacterium]
MANDPIENFRRKAQEALSRGQYHEARLIYQEALGYRSDSPEVHYGVATVCFLLGDLRGAVYHFKEVIRLDPFRATAFINLGAVQNHLGSPDEAMAALRRGVQLDPNRSEGYYNLGLVYKQLGQLDLAIVSYREAIRLDPRMIDAHFNLGNILFEKQQMVMALAHYRQALELRPQWEKAQRAVEQSEAMLGQKDDSSSAQPMVATASAGLNPNRHLEPEIHGVVLHDLHKLVAEINGGSQDVIDFLHKEVEEAIRNLSVCVLGADARLNLDEQMTRMDQVMAKLQGMRDQTQRRMFRAKLLTDKIAKA